MKKTTTTKTKLTAIAVCSAALVMSIFAADVTTGLKLPRLNNTQRDGMAVVNSSNEYAKGQTIYNTSTNQVEYWNGTRWVADKDTIVGNEVVDAADETLERTGSGTTADPYKLKAHVGNLTDSIAKYITGTSLVDTIFNEITYDDSKLQALIDSLLKKTNAVDTIFNEITDSKLQTLLDSLLSKTNAVDTLYSELLNNTNLLDTVFDYLSSEPVVINLRDSIFNKITGTRGITIVPGANDTLEIGLPQGSNDQVLVWESSKWMPTNLNEVVDGDGFGVKVATGLYGITTSVLSTADIKVDSLVISLPTGANGQVLKWSDAAYGGEGGWVAGTDNDTPPETDENTTYTLSVAAGNITLTATPGGGTSNVAVTNGLNATTSNTVKLGGALIEKTTISATSSADSLIIAAPLAITSGTPGLGKVLTSDAAGGASWQAAPATVTVDTISSRGGMTIDKTGAPDEYKLGLVAGTAEGQILQWNNTAQKWELKAAASVIKTDTITVTGANSDVESLSITGSTGSISGSDLKLIGIEPSVTSTVGEAFIADFLMVSATAKVVGKQINYVVKVQNHNIVEDDKFAVEKIFIHYVSNEILPAAGAPTVKIHTGW